MKIKIVQFENGCYGVQTKTWGNENVDWLGSDGCVHYSLRPSIEIYFSSVQEAEEAIQKYKTRHDVYKDKGKLIKNVKI